MKPRVIMDYYCGKILLNFGVDLPTQTIDVKLPKTFVASILSVRYVLP